ncbi:trypco2 family protein [Streptomyces sp. NPDC050538]|uniref:trypco2 family protein n=1 Tax=Streptomyces sp. NPDC050538 TaxID=3365627 RepID=UPI0037992F65
MSSDETNLGFVCLADVVAAVRRDLAAALSDADGQAIRFGVHSIDLDFHVEVVAGASRDQGVQLRVVQGGGSSPTGTNHHRVSMSLRPLHLLSGRPDDLYIGQQVEQRPE